MSPSGPQRRSAAAASPTRSAVLRTCRSPIRTGARDPEETFGRVMSCRHESYNSSTPRSRGNSITVSARASSVGGTSTPSGRVVWRSITNSNLVGRTTGRSAGFSPLGCDPKPTQDGRKAEVARRDLWIGLQAYSALMLAARISLPHFSVSSAMRLLNSDDDDAYAS
jgi:hypothetical protein